MTRTVITGMGASTPVGRDPWAAAAAVRAGISGFAEHPFMVDTAGAPMRVAMAPWLGADCGGVERIAALLLPAMEEALRPLDAPSWRSGRLKLSLELGLPPARPGLPPDFMEKLDGSISESFPERFVSRETFPVGHAGGLLALQSALGKLSGGTTDACLVVGADSYIIPETLECIEERDQFHGAGPLNNAWGFVPGEGAGALLIMGEDISKGLGIPILGSVMGMGEGRETNLINTDSVCIGEGLTAAFRAVLGMLPAGMKVDNIFCDMNGEPYRTDEFGFTALRVREYLQSAGDFTAPADCWGDVGAATGPLCVSLAVISHRKKYGKGPLSLVWAGSESGERAAALILAMEKGKP